MIAGKGGLVRLRSGGVWLEEASSICSVHWPLR